MERLIIKNQLENIYNQGLNQVLDFVETSKPSRLIFPGGSASKLADDLKRMVLAERQNNPECIRLTSRIDVKRYTTDLSENYPTSEKPSKDLWIEDFAGDGGKIRYLRSILPRETAILLLVAPIDANIPNDVTVVMRDDELAKYLHDTRVTSPWERDNEL